MSECNSIETTNIYSNLSDQTNIRLNKIHKIKDYFNSEIEERKIMSNKLCKYIAAFDYIDKTLIALSARSGVMSIIFLLLLFVYNFFFTGPPVGVASASFSLVYSLNQES